jgi:hypothetical protein
MFPHSLTQVQAASRYIEVEDFIFEAISELPEIMEGARKYVKIYKDYPDHSLERKTFDLFLAILKSLNHMMQFFADSSASEWLPPVATYIVQKTG